MAFSPTDAKGEPNASFLEDLVDALSAFDVETAPLGLYACEEYKATEKPFPRLHQEWHSCLAPRLKASGCRIGWIDVRKGRFSFGLPDGDRAEMTVARTSKIKVRKFGSAYRVDPRNDYPDRWKELRLGRELSDLWKPSALAEGSVGLRLFLFIGFAQESEPFQTELDELQNQLDWERHGADYATRSWLDRYNRQFYVRLSGWSRSGRGL